MNRPLPNDVFESHIEDGERDQSLNERRKPQCVRRKIVSRSDQCYGMRDGEASHNRNECTKTSKRYDQAEQEQQVVRSVKNMPEAALDEAPGCLIPPRIESHQARVVRELKGPLCAARRKESQSGQNPDTQPFKSRPNRKSRSV